MQDQILKKNQDDYPVILGEPSCEARDDVVSY